MDSKDLNATISYTTDCGPTNDPSTRYLSTFQTMNVYTASPYADDHLVNGFYVGMMFLMTISGVIGNTLIIGAVLVHKKLMVLSNALIVNLAITDFFVCGFVNVFTIVGVLTRGLFFQDKHIFCEFLGVVCISSCCCSLWTIAAIAFNRYVIICHRVHYPTIFNKRTIPFIIGGLWILSLLVDLPNLLGWGGHAFDKKALFCTYDFMADYTYSIFFAIWLFALPFLVLSYAYVRIVMYSRATKKALRRVQKKQLPSRANIRVTDLRLLRSVLTLWIAFSVLWTPYACVLLFDYGFTWPREFYIFAIAFAHLSSSINSIIYGVTHKNFRDGYIKLLRKLFCMGILKRPDIVESVQSVSQHIAQKYEVENKLPGYIENRDREQDLNREEMPLQRLDYGSGLKEDVDSKIGNPVVDNENGEIIHWTSADTLVPVI